MTGRRTCLLAGCAALICTALVGGCGREKVQGPGFKKMGFPALAFNYEGRSLAEWRALPADVPPEERAAAAWALAALEKEPAKSLQLLLRLLRDSDPSVQMAAVIATGRLAPDSLEAAELVVARFDASVEALRRHARKAAAQLGKAALDPLRQALGDERVRVRWAALAALASMGEVAAVTTDAVRRMALKDVNATVRRQALFTLPTLGPGGVEAGIALLRSTDLALRSEAAAGLVRGGAAVVLPLAELLDDEDEEVAAAAAGILADLGPSAQVERALDALLKALRREGPVRFNAAEALIAIGKPAVGALEKLAKSEDTGLAEIARYVLEQIRG